MLSVSKGSVLVGDLVRRSCLWAVFRLLYLLCEPLSNVYTWCVWAAIHVDILRTGDPRRLAYGIDSFGNVCGAKNSWNGEEGPDFREYKKLYYLNPLDLLNATTFRSARAICVKECPSIQDLCDVDSLPCRAENQYR